ncbi:MAG: hypothetical protein IKM77_10865 [Prevotella sp.]|nr:hypothetical protein [Prevotella sp.]
MKKSFFIALVAIVLLSACGETKTRQEINRRKAALKEHQETELKNAQLEMTITDSLLQVANHQLDSMQQAVEAHKKALKATPEELTALTRQRMKRDSLRTQFETLGMKIRYIHQKMKE